MTRRLTLAILGTVAASLILAGVGTLALARFGARGEIEDELVHQAEALAVIVSQANIQGPADVSRLERFEDAARELSVEGIGLFIATDDGGLVGQLPDGILFLDLDLDAIRAGETVSGAKGGVIYAVASAPRDTIGPGEAIVGVVLTRHDTTVIGPAGRWFVIAAATTVLLGAVVAVTLGRRLTRPLKEATAATHRIAGGDLAARLPEPRPAASDELADLTRSINAMAEALERSRGLEQQFLLSVSHDLRTPLTSIRGYAEAIADGAAPDAPAASRVILAASRRLERLVADLLDLAKLDAKEFSFTLQPVDVAEVVDDVVTGFGPDAADAGITLSLEAPTAATVTADPDRLAQAVANLVENALKFATSRIDVRVEGSTVAVTDDGAGIAAEDLPHVFERLYVADHQPRRREVGSGLGLAIVRELVTAMGGSVRAESPPGGGTRMVLELAPVQAGSEAIDTVAPPTSPVAGGSTDRLT